MVYELTRGQAGRDRGPVEAAAGRIAEARGWGAFPARAIADAHEAVEAGKPSAMSCWRSVSDRRELRLANPSASITPPRTFGPTCRGERRAPPVLSDPPQGEGKMPSLAPLTSPLRGGRAEGAGGGEGHASKYLYVPISGRAPSTRARSCLHAK